MDSARMYTWRVGVRFGSSRRRRGEVRRTFQCANKHARLIDMHHTDPLHASSDPHNDTRETFDPHDPEFLAATDYILQSAVVREGDFL